MIGCKRCNMAKRELSTHAAAAKMIRAEMKKRGIKGRVRSSTFSMGDSVTVTVEDLLPGVVKELEAFVNQFKYGHFDGMTDMYAYSNRREDIPQVKYVTVNAHYSHEMKQEAWEYLRTWLAGYEDKPESYTEAQRCDYDISSNVYRVLNGSLSSFWISRKP